MNSAVSLHTSVFTDDRGGLFMLDEHKEEIPWYGPVGPGYAADYDIWVAKGNRTREAAAIFIRGVCASQMVSVIFGLSHDDFNRTWGDLDEYQKEQWKLFTEKLTMGIVFMKQV